MRAPPDLDACCPSLMNKKGCVTAPYVFKDTMRLEIQDRSAISDAIYRADPDAIIYLFGSRVDDAAKGGDIDLLVLSTKIKLMDKIDILAQLHQSLGERKIDLLVYPDTSRPFARLAMEDGVRL